MGITSRIFKGFSQLEIKFRRAFTLVEVMLVVVIIVGLAALATTNLLRGRIFTQETAASGALRTIAVAQTQYRATHSVFANLADLGTGDPPYIDSNLAAGNKHGHTFVSAPVLGSEATQFIVTAEPQNLNQASTFYTDEDGNLCRSNATNTPAPTGHTANGCPSGFSETQ